MNRKRDGREAAILAFIERYSADHGYQPTVREITEGVGLKSYGMMAGYYLPRLQKAGRIAYVDGKSRTVHIIKEAGNG